ncbi:hypothetical protein AB1Y20_015332 [Prymnesium parvum]|uniref:Uricase n=1 Tax=Prymnesium parvum TaxID=97485 RepID=A0AB34K0E8_PRYPA
MLRRLSLAAAASALAAHTAHRASCRSNPDGITKLRHQDYSLADHNHGKARVRVLRVRRESATHIVQEYTVATRLFSPIYSAVFTEEDNRALVATDTQKNTVYIVAKRSSATTPEGFGIDICRHLLHEYPMLSAVEVDVNETIWQRVMNDGVPHEHGFTKVTPEVNTARVRLTRDEKDQPVVVSGVKGLTVLKTTQSGFTEYLQDKYTLLPPTYERCMATEMAAEWRYLPGKAGTVDYSSVRAEVNKQLLNGYFGPSKGGVYSVSLQATIYDIGCLVLSAAPDISSISISTPNLHYLPFRSLEALGEKFEDDVFIPTNEPSGSIQCKVAR